MKKFILLIALIAVIIISIADYFTGYKLSFSIFYLIPILMIVWFRGAWKAMIIAIIGSVAWFYVDIASGHSYSYPLILLWNVVLKIILFTIIAILFGKAKKEIELEKKLSRLDILTGLDNKRFFMEKAKNEKNRSLRFKRPFTIAYMDIDNFKQLNDVFGHGKGDILLQDLGKIIKKNIRTYDIAARLGGDEFVILFPETDKKQAQEAVNKIKTCVEEVLRKHMDSLTLSIGVVTVTESTHNIEGILKIADDLMYSVKNNSKNGIEYETLN